MKSLLKVGLFLVAALSFWGNQFRDRIIKVILNLL